MSEEMNNDRRRFLHNSFMTIAAAEFGAISSAYALPGKIKTTSTFVGQAGDEHVIRPSEAG